MKLLCDQMLGKLAKWLRIIGYDTFYANSEISDNELLEISKKENRTIITRDKELIEVCKKESVSVIPLKETDLDTQLKQVLKNINISEEMILSRCTICNNLLITIDKEKLKDIIPERIFYNNISFWICPKCRKYYWKGSHYDNMINKIELLKKHFS